uniref:Uncharacterized protein n=1 Tax=Candidatus Kentrum sp. FW TaxID=2126338 RepID=A0A450TVA9_9GAMM|nr:MAG: hypothetical protein BECKFW1821C_GA0114237_104110 [Candidatus Kentron sp. FW]
MAKFPAYGFYFRAENGIGNMCTVPGKQIIHTAGCCHGDMRGVNPRLFGERNLLQQDIGEVFGIFRYIDFRNAMQLLQSFPCRIRIPTRRFLDNQGGDYRRSDALLTPE